MKLPFEGNDLDRELIKATGITPWGELKPFIGGKPFLSMPPRLQRLRLGPVAAVVCLVLTAFLISALCSVALQDHARKPHVQITERADELCIDAMDGWHACVPRR